MTLHQAAGNRTSLRRLLFVAGAIAMSVLSCGREPTAPGGGSGAVRLSNAIGFVAEFPKGVPEFQAAGGTGVAFTKVHVVLRDAAGVIVYDEFVNFPEGQSEVQALLEVPLAANAPASGVPLAMTLDYQTASGQSVFTGGPVTVTAVPAVAGQGPPPPSPVAVTLTYSGPGSNATSVRLSPPSASVPLGGSTTFSAQALDAGGNVVTGSPISFSTSNAAIANVNAATGAVTVGNVRGSATITASLFNAGTTPASAVVTAVGVPAAIAAVSGSGQTGQSGSTLAAPLTARVTAADGLPVAGASVSFVATVGGGSLTSTGVTDAAGLATASWKLGPTVGSQSATATAGNAGGVTFSATATAAPPAKLVISTEPPSTVQSGVEFGLTVQAVDASGALTSGFTGAISLSSGGGLTGPTSLNAIGGVATFTGLKLATPGTYSIGATAIGLGSASSADVIVTAGPASKLTFTAYPGNAAAGATLDAVTVTVKDALGNTATGFTGAVTLSATSPGAGTLIGTTTVNAVAGVASFSGLKINVSGSYTLTASAPGTTSVTGGGFVITSGTPTTLSVASGGGQSAAGSTALPAPVVVKVSDAQGNGIVGVTVTFSPVAGTVSPASAVTGSGGLAQTTWTLGTAAGAQTLHVTSSGLTPNPLVVTATASSAGGPGPATQLIFTTQPSSTINGGSIPAIVVTAKDALGAVATSYTGSVTLAIATNPASGTLAGTVVQVAVAGVATFPGLSINNAGVGYTLQATSSPVLTPATSNAFSITTVTINSTWTGAVDASWTTNGNWSPPVAPIITDAVLIPAGTPFAPTINSAVTVKDLYLPSPATLTNNSTLTVTGTLDAGTTINGSGTLIMNGTGNLQGVINQALLINGGGGVVTLTGTTTISQSVSLTSSSQLVIGANTLNIGTSFSTAGTAKLSMVTAGGVVNVGTNATFNGGSQGGFLSNGTFTLGGHLSGGASSYVGTNANMLRFTGAANKTIAGAAHTFKNTDFLGAGIVDFDNSASATSIQGNITIQAGAGNITGHATVGFLGGSMTDLGTGHWQVDTLNIGSCACTMTLPGTLHGLTRFSSTVTIGNGFTADSLEVTAGTFNMNGKIVNTVGIFRTKSTGKLQMTAAGGQLTVGTTATFAGASEAAALTTGQINIVGGDFVQSSAGGSNQSFVATSGHTVQFIGTGAQTVSFQSPDTTSTTGCTTSCFGSVSINKTGGTLTYLSPAGHVGNLQVVAGSVSASGSSPTPAKRPLVVQGNFTTATSAVAINRMGVKGTFGPGASTVVDTVAFAGTGQTIPAYTMLAMVITGPSVNLAGNVNVTGPVVVLGGLGLGSSTLTVGTTFETQGAGVLSMITSSDRLIVNGNASFLGGSTTGLLTDGRIDIGGDFTQGTTATSFAAVAPHVTWFKNLTGAVDHTVNFANPSAANSHFGAAYFADTLTYFASDVYADGKLETGITVFHHLKSTTGTKLLTSKGADVRNIIFDDVRWLLIDGHAVTDMDNAIFKNFSPTNQIQMEVQRTNLIGMVNFTTWNFQTAPTGAGRYLKVTDTDGATNGVTTVTFSAGISPASAGGFLETLGGAVVNGWTNAFTWTGLTNTDWHTNTNWNTLLVPGALNDVIVPTGPSNQPHISAAATTVTNLTINTGIGVILNGNSLTVNGDLTIASGGNVNINTSHQLTVAGNVIADTAGAGAVTNCNGASVGLNLTGASKTVKGRFCNLFVNSGSYTLNGPMVVDTVNLNAINTGFLQVSGGSGNLTLAGNRLRTAKFNTSSSGILTMTNASDSLIVYGDAAFAGGTSSLTNGNLVIGGNFDQSAISTSFRASGAHRVTMNGTLNQSIFFANPDTHLDPGCAAAAASCFYNLKIDKPSGKIQALSTVKALNNIDLIAADSLAAGGQNWIALNSNNAAISGAVKARRFGYGPGIMTRAGGFAADTLYAIGTLTLPLSENIVTVTRGTATLPVRIYSTVIADSGTIVAAGVDTIFTDFATRNVGKLQISNNADTVIVSGNAVFNGANTTGLLTAGAFRAGGNFTATGQKYDASGTHLTTLYSASPQTTTWNSAVANQGFQKLTFTGAGTKTFAGTNYINGALTFDASLTGTVSGSVSVYAQQVIDNSTILFGALTGSMDLHITGNAPSGFPAILRVNTVTFEGGGNFILANNLTTNNIIVDNGSGLIFNGHIVKTNQAGSGNNFTTKNGGVINMSMTADSLDLSGGIGGTAYFNGGASTLTKGAIAFGKLYQGYDGASVVAGAAANSFSPTAGLRAHMSTSTATQIYFKDPGSGSSLSHFWHLKLTSASTNTLKTDMFVDSVMIAEFTGANLRTDAFGVTPRKVTTKGLYNTGTFGVVTLGGIQIVLVDGVASTLMGYITWNGFPASYTGTVFEQNRSSGSTISLNNNNFTAISVGGAGKFINNIGSIDLNLASVTGLTGGLACTIGGLLGISSCP